MQRPRPYPPASYPMVWSSIRYVELGAHSVLMPNAHCYSAARRRCDRRLFVLEEGKEKTYSELLWALEKIRLKALVLVLLVVLSRFSVFP